MSFFGLLPSLFGFASPLVLLALAGLPALWLLLRLTPPRPQTEVFPPLRILARLMKREETPARSPWWLTLLRMLLAALVILAMAGPSLNPRSNWLSAQGPLVLVIDNGWASAGDWPLRRATAEDLIEDARARNLSVALALTAAPAASAEARPVLDTPDAALARLRGARPQPLVPDRAAMLSRLTTALAGTRPGSLVYLSDGIATPTDVLAGLAALQPQALTTIMADGSTIGAMTRADNGADGLQVTVTRLNRERAETLPLAALDNQGRAIASGTARFEPGAARTTATIAAPFELRNDIARLALGSGRDAGSVYLLDDGFRRRKVALVSGEAGDQLQPLLSPLYYIERALKPYADLVKPQDLDLSKALPALIEDNPAAIVLADVGRLPPEAADALGRWIGRGGSLIRFAGPRLAAAPADDPLLPVALRQGERSLGGALSWAEPQPLGPFPSIGPFAGLPTAGDVHVKRQVLAEPVPGLEERTWASLADGTPLVTVKTAGAGRIVLFHVSGETAWSDLPLSGTFVEMLHRVVQLSRPVAADAAKAAGSTAGTTAPALPPLRLLAADGSLSGDLASARPLKTSPAALRPSATPDNPPGLYGSDDAFTAVNLLPADAELVALDPAKAPMPVDRRPLVASQSVALAPWLLAAASLLIALDGLAVLFIHGVLRLPRIRRTGATTAATTVAMLLAPFLLGAAIALLPAVSHAADNRPGDDILKSRLDTTHLAYVVTGEEAVDTLSRQGLAGLTEYLAFRTALEPGEPQAIDLDTDELAAFPLIYWPVSATAPMPSPTAISRIDAYMRAGGSVLFDTRDQYDALEGGATSANGARLQQILGSLDIPPLEPVPAGHVLTKSFYLLPSFPGRYAGSPLWIAARNDAENLARGGSGDGVSPILITGNDFAGAWAIDDYGAPILPTVPQDDRQREMAFRAGVNIMMYMLTGNYKADQVHVPALLERLGQ